MKACFDVTRLRGLASIVLLGGLAAAPASAQPNFNSTSTGADGALNLTTPGTIVFDPTSFNPPLNPSGNNIFNFTTINISAGVTVRLSARYLIGSVYWLASGAVTIAGTLDLNGEDGPGRATSQETRIPADPGAGGYAGGVAGSQFSTPPLMAQPGSGPGGGAAGASGIGAATNGGVGSFAGSNFFLVPLVGGSGGGGGDLDDVILGSGGGAGGGAVLIASSTSISITGRIQAIGGVAGNCGQSGCGGAGSGGAIRLVAPLVNGNGSVAAAQVRIETSSYPDSLVLSHPFTISSTPNLYLPASPPGALKVVSVGGVNLPASPTASFAVPDATVNASAAVPVVIQASNIPPGTVATLQFFSDNGPDFSLQAPALAGTMAQSTATVQVMFPAGFTRGYVLASW